MLNMDFSKRVVIDTNKVPWQPTGIPGVTVKPLALEDSESGHLTAMLRYQDESVYTRKELSMGEELLILAGTFTAASGDYATGTYYRNPSSMMQIPFSQRGCVMFAKMNQVQRTDSEKIVRNVYTTDWLGADNGIKMQILNQHAAEQTLMVKWPKNYSGAGESNITGAEVFVISGELIDDNGRYPAGTWLRSPSAPFNNAYTETETVAFIKYGHLRLN